MEPGTNRLELTPEQMRSLGYRVVDQLVEHFAGLRDRPVTGVADRSALEARLCEPVPRQGMDPQAVLELLSREVWSHMVHLDHPRFFAFVPSPGNFVSAMADALVAGLNPFAGTWLESAGPAMIELVVVDWLCRLCGLPESAGGHFTSGGSVANLTALAVARHLLLADQTQGAVVYCSDQTHSSVARALWLLGFAPGQIRRLPADEQFRLPVPALRAAVTEDRQTGRRPFCVVANAGTTNTGAVDPLAGIAGFCRAEGLWLHVDGAYGAAAVLAPRGRALLAGLEHADSLVLDPHKWLFQPYEMGCVLVRQAGWLEQTFRILPGYLTDAQPAAGEVNFCDQGLQLTRSFRALKLWMSLKTFGLEAFGQAVERGLHLAAVAEAWLRAGPDWEIVSPAELSVVCFRFAPSERSPAAIDGLNRHLVAAMLADGFAFLSSTVLADRPVLRLCFVNPRTRDEDVRQTLQRLDGHARRLVQEQEGKLP